MRFEDENPLNIGSKTWFKARYFSRRFCNRFWPRLGRVLAGFGEGLGRVLELLGRSWAMFWCHFFGLACGMGSKRALGVDFGLLGEGFGRGLGGFWGGFAWFFAWFFTFVVCLLLRSCALFFCFGFCFALLFFGLCCLSLFAFWPSISESISSAFRSWLATTSSGKRFSVFGGWNYKEELKGGGWVGARAYGANFSETHVRSFFGSCRDFLVISRVFA